jgi:hypothetical protein
MQRGGPSEVLQSAVETGRSVRIHLSDGEVVVARVLSVDFEEVVYAALTSSRPERYAVCDSTGARARLDAVERAVLLRD